MSEIAAMFCEGFSTQGGMASVRVDEMPVLHQPGILQVVVAPHEFVPLFLRGEVDEPGVYRALESCYMLCTEQPGSQWFDEALTYVRGAKGVFDISTQAVAAFRRMGIPAIHSPLGYSSLLEDCGCQEHQKDIDIIHLGVQSPKRELFFSKHTEFLSKHNCRLLFASVEKPRHANTPGFVVGSQRNALLRRSKILINIHFSDRIYFEWHRALIAMANRCLVISENSESMEPLRNGDHLVICPIDEIMASCEKYLSDNNEREAIVNRAYEMLHSELPIQASCRTILDAAARRESASVSLCEPGSQTTGVRDPQPCYGPTAAVLPSASFVTRCVAASKQALRRVPLARRTYRGLKDPHLWLTRPTDWLREWLTRLRELEPRRRAIIQRLNKTVPSRFTHVASDYNCIYNKHYADASPTVSVVITLYNYQQYIAECLQSIDRSEIGLLPGGAEIVVVDDASADCSVQVAQREIDHSRLPVCLISKATNTGLADARNLGVSRARSPYVFILDADNWIYPNCLSKLYKTIINSGAAAAYGIIAKFDQVTQRSVGLLSDQAWNVGRLITANYIDAMALLDREKVISVGGYSTDLIKYGWLGLEDYDLWLKLADAGYSATFHPEVVAAYRVHSDSMVNTTIRYLPQLASYFNKKFADLVARYPDGPMRFGQPIPLNVGKPGMRSRRAAA